MEDDSGKWLDKIKEACYHLGWELCFDDSNETISGMIVGSLEYIERISNHEEDFENYQVYNVSSVETKDMH